jgi:hypothetical protein
MYSVLYCSPECGIQHVKDLVDSDYFKHLILVPLPLDTITAVKDTVDDIQARTLALPYDYTGAMCDNCTARHMGGTPKFKMCGACTNMRYCSVECQREHWKAGHKKTCNKPPTTILEIKPSVPSYKQHAHELAEEATHARCFDANELARRKAARAGTCSWRECDEVVEGPRELSFHMVLCSQPGGGAHITPTAYCCAGHRNRDHAGYIGSSVGTGAHQ